MSKYTGETLEFVQEILKKQKCSIAEATRQMCDEFNIDYSETARVCITRNLKKSREKENPIISTEFSDAQDKRLEKDKQTFIITWAQNSTQVHENLWKNIQAYSKHLDAAIHVIAGKYNGAEQVWDSKVKPYLDANRHNVHKYLQILSDVPIQPTASTPLSGLNGFSGLESCVVGHPRQHLKSLPVLEGYPHKLLLSTGAVTLPNYTASKVGKKGEFHHMFGFILVELDGENFHIRQINADDAGNFYNLYDRVIDGEVKNNEEGITTAILGDVHVRHNDPIVTDLAFKLIEDLKPDHVIVHDIAEMESILHWDLKDPFKLLEKEESGADDLEQEINEVFDWLEEHKQYNLVLVRSNHDDMLDRWLQSTDWRKSPNKKMYLRLSNIIAEGGEKVRMLGILPHMINERFKGEITTLSLDDSFRVLGWELALHGHLGANGSRGGHIQFKNLNTKNIVGHGHHPHREDGHIMVGTLTHLRVGFNRGASNWMNSLGVIYPDSKAQLIHFVKGKYCR